MKKHQREIYIILADEVNTGIAMFCKYADCICGGGMTCKHPLEVVRNLTDDDYGRCSYPGEDCWGFRPKCSVQDAADLVGIILQKQWHSWSVWEEEGQLYIAGGTEVF